MMTLNSVYLGASRFVTSKIFWPSLILVGVLLECVALFYQYVLNEPPCVLCIQARFWVLASIVFASMGMATRKSSYMQLISIAAVFWSYLALANRAATTLLVEQGRYEGVCGMDPGFPSWFALDEWFPFLFEVWAMCGYTPEIAFGVTMAEGLFYGSVALVAVVLFALYVIASKFRRDHGRRQNSKV